MSAGGVLEGRGGAQGRLGWFPTWFRKSPGTGKVCIGKTPSNLPPAPPLPQHAVHHGHRLAPESLA